MVRPIYSFANNAMQIKIVTSDIRYDGLFLKKFLTEIKEANNEPFYLQNNTLRQMSIKKPISKNKTRKFIQEKFILVFDI